ncbi:CBO0543 family protein [Neobacillus drentensis]|uniref:CBO0543 family protein n=1 Tax=Neobacillus drentensis TaxID=220684 RepID=UPI002FFF1FB9
MLGEFIMIAIIYSVIWIIVAFKFADRNWKLYYPTMLFASLGNALYDLICYKYQLWQMEPNGLPVAMIPILLLILIGMPLSTWVYLSKYPFRKGVRFQALYIAFFTVIYIILEYVSVKGGSITYHHHWNLLWSLLFVIVMFTIMRIHFKKPLLALILSAIFAIFLCLVFDVTLDKMK